MLATINRCFELIGSRWRRRWLALLPLTVLTAVLELLAASSVFVLIRVITDETGGESIGWLTTARERLGIAAGSATAVAVAIAVAVLFLLKAGLRLSEVYLRERWVHGSLTDLATRLFGAYLDAPYSFHLRRSSAELLRAIHEGVHSVCGIVLQSVAITVNEILLAGAVVVVLLFVTPWVSLLVALVIVALCVAILAGSQRLASDWGRRLHEASGGKLRLAQQGFASAKEVKLLGRSAFFIDSFRRLRRDEEVEVAWATFQWLPRLTMETLFVGGIAVLVVVAHLTSSQPWSLAPTLGMFAFAAIRLLPSFYLILHHLNRVQLSEASVAAVYDDYRRLGPSAVLPQQPLSAMTRDIRFESVSFTYEGAARPALTDIDLIIAAGESIGVVGSTGSGKSTLMYLLLGLLQPSTGRICVDSHDIESRTSCWQRQIGYVPQHVYLLDASIAANIAFGIDDPDVDRLRVIEVARMAQLQDWIESLPAGLDTLVGERGVRVSGGERQRIAIARALYRDPGVLVFDEATAALDNRTEKELSETIQRLHGRKTLLIVAHRLTTVRECTRLVFLRDGRIADIGTYAELLGRNREFQRLAATLHSS